MTNIKQLLPRGVAAWCHGCNGFVAADKCEETYSYGEYKIVDGKRRDFERGAGRRLAFFCAKCKQQIDVNNLPHQAIDRLRFIAEVIHAEGRTDGN